MSGIGYIISNEYEKNKPINLNKLFSEIESCSTADNGTENEEIDVMHCLNALEPQVVY